MSVDIKKYLNELRAELEHILQENKGFIVGILGLGLNQKSDGSQPKDDGHATVREAQIPMGENGDKGRSGLSPDHHGELNNPSESS